MEITVQVWWVSAGSSVALVPAASKAHAELVLFGLCAERGTAPDRWLVKARRANPQDVDRFRSWAAHGDENAVAALALCGLDASDEVDDGGQIELFAS